MSTDAFWIVPLAAAVSLAALLALLGPLRRHLPVDRPNERSLHAGAVPRTGGIAILCGIAGTAAFIDGAALAALAIALALALLSFVDDRHGLPAGVRLAAHLAAAAGIVLGFAPEASLWVLPAAVLAIAWMTNLYNFMDGANGLAGGMAVIGFSLYAVVLAAAGESAPALLAAATAASAAVFLCFNFDPARVFLGDAGSVPLGFLAGALGWIGWREGVWPFWFPFVAFAPFVADASVTLVRRALRGERVWRAHREHHYQRLIRMGWSHRRTALAAYAAMLLSAALALAAHAQPPALQAALLGALGVALATAFVAVDRAWRRHATHEAHR